MDENNTLTYYAYLKANKLLVDREFKNKHEPRAMLPTETFEEYDAYLSSHLQSYEIMLTKQGLGNLVNADINCYDNVTVLDFKKTDLMNRVMLSLISNEYGFDDDFFKNNRSFIGSRKNYITSLLTDLYIFVNMIRQFIVEEDVLILHFFSREKPTFMTKINDFIAKRLGYRISKPQNNLWERIVNNIFN